MDLKDFNFEMPKVEMPQLNLNALSDMQRQFEKNTEEMNKYRQKKDNAVFDTAAALRSINEKLEQERSERISVERKAKKWKIAAFIIGALTLAATILFGLLTVLG